MPDRDHVRVSARMRVEWIEADIEQAFGLVDLAEEAALHLKYADAEQIFCDADRVLLDIDTRVAQLTPSEAWPFFALVEELRRSLNTVRSRMP